MAKGKKTGGRQSTAAGPLKAVAVRLSPALVEQVKEIAEREGITLRALVTRALETEVIAAGAGPGDTNGPQPLSVPGETTA